MYFLIVLRSVAGLYYTSQSSMSNNRKYFSTIFPFIDLLLPHNCNELNFTAGTQFFMKIQIH